MHRRFRRALGQSLRSSLLTLVLSSVVATGLALVDEVSRSADPASAVSSWSQVAVGNSYTCALSSAGKAFCWGDNWRGQLGDGTLVDHKAAAPVVTSLTFSSIDAGADHTCALTTAGAAYCWGAGTGNQIGNGGVVDVSLPTAVSGGRVYSQISAGFGHSCAIETTTDNLYCWGNNLNGQGGNDTMVNISVPTLVSAGFGFSSVSAGIYHTCGIRKSNGAAYCWGWNANNQLGDNTVTDRDVPTLVQGGRAYSRISAGKYFSCAIQASDDAAYCWGYNGLGQLGDNTITQRPVPTAVNGSLDFAEIVAVVSVTCGITTAGQGYCWGDGINGRLGTNATTDSLVPVAVFDGANLTGMDGYSGSHCARRTTTNAVVCWGENFFGNLGDGYDNAPESPELIPNVPAFTVVESGWDTACGLTSAGAAYCWGANTYGQIGDGTTTKSFVPKLVLGGLAFSDINVGTRHTCALTTAGAAYCWGDNSLYQGGDGTAVSKLTPSPVSGGLVFSKITTGDYHTCAIRASNSYAYCWGDNAYGNVGDNTTSRKSAPTLANGSLAYTDITGGYYHTCAVTTANSPRCWGYNANGQLGDNSLTNRYVPTTLFGSVTFSSISAGGQSTCAIRASNSAAYCWGDNTYGQLGDNSITDRDVPTLTNGGFAYSRIVRNSSDATCAVTTANGIKCWGAGDDAQLGDGAATQRLVPTSVNSNVTFSTLALGGSYTCASSTADALYCWGEGYMGSIPNGAPDHWYPMDVNWPPEDPTTAGQYRSDGTTVLATAGWTNQTTVVLKSTLTDTNSTEAVSLCVELDLETTPFSGVEDSCGTAVTQGNTATVTLTVANGNFYHWQVRAKDAMGGYSHWVKFNLGDMAFGVDTVAPDTPSDLTQYRSDGTTPHPAGAWTADPTAVFGAMVADSFSSVSVCIEVKPVGTGFSNVDTVCGVGGGSGMPGFVTHTLVDATAFHWQLRARDSAGNYSAWVSYGGNAESARDIGTDTTAPTGGTVYDGTTAGVDRSFNDGSLSSLSFNWSGVNSNVSGISRYDYAIGTTAGATDIRGWTNNGTATSVTANSLVLQTNQRYFASIRAVDNAGNVSVIGSNGQVVAPTLTFTLSTTSIVFDRLYSGNSYTSAPKTLDVTVSSNGYNGYIVRQYAAAQMTSGSFTIPFYTSSYAAPTAWSGTGFGYTSDDTTIQASGDLFGSGSKYAGLTTGAPGHIVADHTTAVAGTPITNQVHRLTYRLAAASNQTEGDYVANIRLGVTPIY